MAVVKGSRQTVSAITRPHDMSDTPTLSGSRSDSMNLRTTALPVPPDGCIAAGSSPTKEEVARLESRVLELEHRLRETEEELEFYFAFFKKTRRAGSSVIGAKGASSRLGDSASRERSRGNGADQGRKSRGEYFGGIAMEAGWPLNSTESETVETDSDSEEDVVLGNANYTGELDRPRTDVR